MALLNPPAEPARVFQGHSSNRYERPMRVSWSGIAAGTALGWAVLSLISLIGAAVGFAKFDPYSAQPANGLGTGSSVFGILALLISSFLGAFMAVRVAGDRRRGEAILHGVVCWAFSMLIGAGLALGAARTAAQSAATVASGPRAQAKAQREGNVRERNGGPTQQDRQAADETSSIAAKTSGAAAGGAFLALIAAVLGGLVAASRSAGKSLLEEVRPANRPHGQIPRLSGEDQPGARV